MANAAQPWVKEQLKQSPVRAVRSKHFKDLSSFASESRTSYSVAYFTELGCYSSIPNVLLSSLGSKGVDVGKLQSDYFKFQNMRRGIFGHTQLLPKMSTIESVCSSRSCSIITILKSALELSRADLSKGLCVQTASLYRLENDLVPELPQEVYLALVHCGVPSKTVEAWNVRERKR